MATYYIDPRATGDDQGGNWENAIPDPFDNTSPVVQNNILNMGADHTLIFANGQVFEPTVQRNNFIEINNARTNVTIKGEENTFIADGSTDVPMIRGDIAYTGWTLETGSAYSVSVTNPGVVQVDYEGNGIYEALTWIEWDTDLTTTEAAMPPNSYTFNDGDQTKVYVKMRNEGDPDTEASEVRVARCFRGIAAQSAGTDSISNLLITGIGITGFRNAGTYIVNASGNVNKNLFKWNGGGYTSVMLGSGIQFGGGCTNLTIEDNICWDAYDSPITVQTNEGTNAETGNIIIRNNFVFGGALGGIEMALQTSTGPYMHDVTVEGNRFYKQGRGFGLTGDIQASKTPAAVRFLGATGRDLSGGLSDNLIVRDNVIVDVDGDGVHIINLPGDHNVYRNRIIDCTNHGIYYKNDRTGTSFQGTTEDHALIAEHNEIINAGVDGVHVYERCARTNNDTNLIQWNTIANSGSANIRVDTTSAGNNLINIRSNVLIGGTSDYVGSGTDVNIEDYNSSDKATSGLGGSNDITSATLNMVASGTDHRIASASGDAYNNAHAAPSGTDCRNHPYSTNDRGAFAQGKG